MEDLSKQLRDLQEEFNKNSSATQELEEALCKTRQVNEELEAKIITHNQEKETAQENIKELESRCKVLDLKMQEMEGNKQETLKKMEAQMADTGKYSALEETVKHLESKIAEKDIEISQLKEQANKLDVSMGRDLQFQLDEANIEISQLQSECSKLERKAVNLEKLYKQKTQQNFELNDELNKLKVAKEMLEEDMQDQDEMEEKMTALSKESEEWKERLKMLEAERQQEKEIVNETIQQQNSELNKKLVELQDGVNKEEHVRNALKSELEAATKELKKTEVLKETMEQENAELTKKIYEYQEILKKEEQIRSALESELQATTKELKKIEVLNKAVQLENAEFTEKIGKLQDHISKEETIRNALESKLETATTELKNMEELNKSKQVQEKRIQELQDQLASCADCKEWEEKNVEIEKVLTKVKGEVTELQREIEPLQKEMTTLKDDLKAKTMEVGELQEQCEIVKGDLGKKEQTFIETLEKLEQTKDQYDALSKEMELVNKDLADKKVELDKLKSAQADVLEQLNTSNSHVHELSDAKLKFAEIKSSLHMQKTLYEKAKADLIVLKEEKTKLVSDNARLVEQVRSLDDKVGCEETREEEMSCLKTKMAEMQQNLKNAEEKSSVLQLEKSELEKKCEEIENNLTSKSAKVSCGTCPTIQKELDLVTILLSLNTYWYHMYPKHSQNDQHDACVFIFYFPICKYFHYRAMKGNKP